MTEQFFSTLKATLANLVKDLRYLHKPSGALVAPQIIDVMLPRPTEQVEEAEEYPFVRWLVHAGEFHRQSPGSFSVLIDGGLYTDGTVSDGNAEINQLCLALGNIIEFPCFAPYKLNGAVRYIIGTPCAAPEEHNPGLQPHPYYHCRLFLEFIGYHH